MKRPGGARCETIGRFSSEFGGTVMRFANSTDESLLAYYESVRRQILADDRLGGRYRLIGANVRQYAEQLKAEMERRQLRVQPIKWP
jgi:hypothetical protein